LNFFKLYIGDYMRDTGTLSVAEHGAYLLMLMHHYATEKPLPTGRELHRLLRAETKADREAIDSVASKFWYAGADGQLFNKRADAELIRAEHQREVNRTVGKLGGRPKRTVTESVSERNPNYNPNQTPDTINSPTESKARKRAPECPANVSAQVWADWLALRAKKRAPVTSTVIASAIGEAGRAGMTLEAFLTVWCARGSQGLQAEWLKPTERPQPTAPSRANHAETDRLLRQLDDAKANMKPPPASILAMVGKAKTA
jgi:uncharacterized protein YdaU (DUF1376 family)